jgi:Tol biopolymer transport system component
VKRFSMLDFTPDGREVVYQNRAGLLVAMDVSTGEQRTLFDCGKDPCFADVSPEGDRLAIGTAEGLQVVDLATGDAVTLVAEGGFDPQWSPDGGAILYSGADRDLYRIPAREGAAPTRMVETERHDYVHQARWSPDGRTIAYFLVDVHAQQFIGDYTATLLPADGSSEPRSLFVAVRNCCGGWTPPAVVWAPDGSPVFFGSNRHPTRAYTSDGERIEDPDFLPQLLGHAAWQPLPEPTDEE